MFNRALGLGLEDPASDEQLDEALDFLDGVLAYVAVAPEAEPGDLGDATRGAWAALATAAGRSSVRSTDRPA